MRDRRYAPRSGTCCPVVTPPRSRCAGHTAAGTCDRTQRPRSGDDGRGTRTRGRSGRRRRRAGQAWQPARHVGAIGVVHRCTRKCLFFKGFRALRGRLRTLWNGLEQPSWCPWPESNQHSLRNSILSRARLPVPPQGPSGRPERSVAKPADYSHGTGGVNPRQSDLRGSRQSRWPRLEARPNLHPRGRRDDEKCCHSSVEPGCR
jgi:hypothetical protein